MGGIWTIFFLQCTSGPKIRFRTNFGQAINHLAADLNLTHFVALWQIKQIYEFMLKFIDNDLKAFRTMI